MRACHGCCFCCRLWSAGLLDGHLMECLQCVVYTTNNGCVWVQALGDAHQPMMPAQMAATMSLAGIDKGAIQVGGLRWEI